MSTMSFEKTTKSFRQDLNVIFSLEARDQISLESFPIHAERSENCKNYLMVAIKINKYKTQSERKTCLKNK